MAIISMLINKEKASSSDFALHPRGVGPGFALTMSTDVLFVATDVGASSNQTALGFFFFDDEVSESIASVVASISGGNSCSSLCSPSPGSPLSDASVSNWFSVKVDMFRSKSSTLSLSSSLS